MFIWVTNYQTCNFSHISVLDFSLLNSLPLTKNVCAPVSVCSTCFFFFFFFLRVCVCICMCVCSGSGSIINNIFLLLNLLSSQWKYIFIKMKYSRKSIECWILSQKGQPMLNPWCISFHKQIFLPSDLFRLNINKLNHFKIQLHSFLNVKYVLSSVVLFIKLCNLTSYVFQIAWVLYMVHTLNINISILK